MKKQIITWGLMFAATLALSVSCAKEQDMIAPGDESLEPVGVPFELFAGVETKTTTDGENHFSWATDDAMAVFYRENGSDGAYSTNNKFEWDTDNHFSGTLAAALENGKNYDWWALYPYRSAITSPANTDKGALVIESAQTQTGNSSKAHLAGASFPLYGHASNVGFDAKPSIAMNQALSVLKIHVTNTSDAALTVSSVSVTAPESITGSFYVGFAGETPVFTEVTSAGNKVASLTVKSGTPIAATNGEADFFVAIKPFEQAVAGQLVVSVNGLDKVITIPAETKFKPGKIKTVNFTYDGVSAFNWVETALADLTSSDVFVIVGNSTYAMPNNKGTSDAPDAVAVTVAENKITSLVPERLRWNVSGDNTNGYTFYPNGYSSVWLYCNTTATSGSNNNMRVGTGNRKVFELSGNKLITKDTNVNRYISIYSSQDWRGYTSSSNGATIKFYKKVADNREDPGMSWSAASATATYSTGNSLSFTAPTLTPGNASSVTYSSSDETIATIGATTGVVTVNLTGNTIKEGSTTISATFDGDATYQSQTVNYTLTVVDGRDAVATPTFNPAAGEVAANTVVNFECTTASVTFHYTVDGSAPTVESTSGTSVTIDAAKTVKVIATKDGYKPSEIASATYSVAGSGNDGSLEHPYTVAEALTIISGYSNNGKSAEQVYVSGIVANVGSYNGKFHSVTYDISDNGQNTNTLNIYSGKFVGNTNFTSNTQISVNDEVIVYGYLYLYETTKEMYQNNYIYSLNGLTVLPTITKTDITGVSAEGVTGETTNVTLTNDDGWTPSVVADGTIVTEASIVGTTITYSVAANTGNARDGSITVKLSRANFTDISAVITVSQLSSSGAPTSYSVTYTQTFSGSGHTVATSGTAPAGSSCSWTTTYSNSNQLTKDKSMTYTLTGYDGKKITGLSLHMKTNSKSGTGTVSMKHGTTEFGSYSVPVIGGTYGMKDATVTATTIGTGETVTVVISASENSVYCDYITITYE